MPFTTTHSDEKRRALTIRLVNILRDHKDRWMRTSELIALMDGEFDSRWIHLLLKSVPGIEHEIDRRGKSESLWTISKKPAAAYIAGEELVSAQIEDNFEEQQ
jgi:hypothetical protein